MIFKLRFPFVGLTLQHNLLGRVFVLAYLVLFWLYIPIDVKQPPLTFAST